MDGGAHACEHGCTYCYGMVYECCVANHMQGWPKFVNRQWAIAPSSGGKAPAAALSILQYFSSRISDISLSARRGGKETEQAVSVNVSTAYPLEQLVSLSIVASAAFTLQLRIPGWCTHATLAANGAAAGQLQHFWAGPGSFSDGPRKRDFSLHLPLKRGCADCHTRKDHTQEGSHTRSNAMSNNSNAALSARFSLRNLLMTPF